MNAIETRKLAQSLGIKNVAKFRTAELQAQITEIQAAQAAEAAKAEAEAREAAKAATAPVFRKGTSRVGMTLVVPVRASGAEKAAAVQGQLPTGLKVIVKSTKTHTALGIEGDGFKVALLWDVTGAYAYAESFIQETGNRKIKVRNAKAALAFIAKRTK